MKPWLALIVPFLGAAHSAEQCSAPVPVPVTITTPHSTYYNDGEPPKRFAHVPKQALTITFGKDAINKLCGKPPCGMEFEGCADGNRMALPDPFSVSPETFARIVRHELGHENGWSETHGD